MIICPKLSELTGETLYNSDREAFFPNKNLFQNKRKSYINFRWRRYEKKHCPYQFNGYKIRKQNASIKLNDHPEILRNR